MWAVEDHTHRPARYTHICLNIPFSTPGHRGAGVNRVVEPSWMLTHIIHESVTKVAHIPAIGIGLVRPRTWRCTGSSTSNVD